MGLARHRHLGPPVSDHCTFLGLQEARLRRAAQLSEWLDGHDLEVWDLTLLVCEQFFLARRARGTLCIVKALALLREHMSDLEGMK
jgi:hypothetical protein